jgi:hypothetical protein
MEGSVRFPVTPQNAPSSFQHGHDLLLPSGILWQIILPQVACRAAVSAIRDQLLEENLVMAEQLPQCLATCGNLHPANTLFRVN